ncbi:MAG: TolC family protein [Isosphaeraceae bacterium]|nr:TolC family protein [Isosphaeraceae bacterium]
MNRTMALTGRLARRAMVSVLIAAPAAGATPVDPAGSAVIPWSNPFRAEIPVQRRPALIPSLNPFRSADPGLRRASSADLPLPLPGSLRGDVVTEATSVAARAVAQPAIAAVDPTLIPGRILEPIDLCAALRLAGARDIDIAIARQRIEQALADLARARSLWLPSLFLGPTWYRADGQVQTVTGQVINVNRSSLFLGGTAALPNGFPAPSPGTGYPQLNSLSSVLRISDMIFEPLAARRVVAANRAGLQATTNDALLTVAEAYFDLQMASGQLAIAREAAANADALAQITASYARTGQGLEADHRRALAELNHQRRNIDAASGRLLVASTNLVRLLVLDARLVIAPVEPAETMVRLIPDEVPLDDLVLQAFQGRPELAQYRELVEAAVVRLKQARLRPFIPSVALTYAGGGMGGGQGSFFGNFGARGDVMASLFWELQHLGFADRAVMRRSAADHRVAELELVRVETQVAADVTAAFVTRTTAARQVDQSRETVREAVDSLDLNFVNIRQGAGLPRATRPIEVLQPIQALAQARLDYLDSVLAYNRAQFRLKRAIGQQP